MYFYSPREGWSLIASATPQSNRVSRTMCFYFLLPLSSHWGCVKSFSLLWFPTIHCLCVCILYLLEFKAVFIGQAIYSTSQRWNNQHAKNSKDKRKKANNNKPSESNYKKAAKTLFCLPGKSKLLLFWVKWRNRVKNAAYCVHKRKPEAGSQIKSKRKEYQQITRGPINNENNRKKNKNGMSKICPQKFTHANSKSNEKKVTQRDAHWPQSRRNEKKKKTTREWRNEFTRFTVRRLAPHFRIEKQLFLVTWRLTNGRHS